MARVTKQELELKISDLESEVSRLETIKSNYAESNRMHWQWTTSTKITHTFNRADKLWLE